MKRGNDLRDSKSQPTRSGKSREIPVLMFVMAEKAPNAFTLRLVTNEDVLGDIRKQGALDTFLRDADELTPTFEDGSTRKGRSALIESPPSGNVGAGENTIEICESYVRPLITQLSWSS